VSYFLAGLEIDFKNRYKPLYNRNRKKLDTGIIIKNQSRKYNLKNGIFFENLRILTFWKVYFTQKVIRTLDHVIQKN